jgi:hypothetical protein
VPLVAGGSRPPEYRIAIKRARSPGLDIFRCNGDGGFSLFRPYPLEEFGSSMQIANLNADGNFDVVIATGLETLIFGERTSRDIANCLR